MASSNPFLFCTLSLVCFFFFESKPFVSAIREEATELQNTREHNTHDRVHLSSLIPSSSCSFPPQGANRNGSLEVVHKHGPCSKLKKPSSSSSSSSSSFIIPHSEILKQDETRVRAIQSKLSKTQTSKKGLDRVQLPAKSGYLLGAGNYFVTVGLGTPKRHLSLNLDTGSDLTWTQCKPCAGSCYTQKEPIFDPSQSSSYSNISCSSSLCSQLASATGECELSRYVQDQRACIYVIGYGDGSISAGYFAKEKLTISPTDVFDDFFFGCGQNNLGLLNGTAGLLGLGRDPLSFVEQTAQKYRKMFSYCLPSTPSTVGYIAFGGRCSSCNVIFTPLSSIFRNSSFYGLDFTGITVGGINLPFCASVFSSGTLIDSGTVITRLPPAAYGSLRDAFQRLMSRYPKANPFSILDTCYNVKGFEVVYIPTISLWFGGGVNVKVDVTGVVVAVSEEEVCLAFTANKDDRDVAIIGNTQQKTLEVVYDVASEKIGFRPRACT